jgi:predicted transposase YdaD
LCELFCDVSLDIFEIRFHADSLVRDEKNAYPWSVCFMKTSNSSVLSMC